MATIKREKADNYELIIQFVDKEEFLDEPLIIKDEIEIKQEEFSENFISFPISEAHVDTFHPLRTDPFKEETPVTINIPVSHKRESKPPARFLQGIKDDKLESKDELFKKRRARKIFKKKSTKTEKQQIAKIPKIPKLFSCFKCESKFRVKSEMLEHSKNHYVEKYGSLNNHIVDPKKPYQCDLCPWRFNSKNFITAHLMYVHSNFRPFKCTECSHAFPIKNALMDHIKSVHIQDRPQKCQQCPKSFKIIHHLKEHVIRIHKKPKERNFTCKICDRKFFNQLDLNVHWKRSHGGKPEQ